MSMTQSRYMFIRERAFFLYNILNNRMYGIWVAPKTLMTLEEVRNRGVSNNEGSLADHNYFNEFQLRRMNIPAIIDILPNVMHQDDIGFENAGDTVLEIYESIQEYISLWCEIIVNAPEFKTPPKSELRYLEALAYHIFPLYKSIKPYKVDNDLQKQIREDESLNRKGLLGLGILFGFNKKVGEISFVSHLDELEATPEFVGGGQLFDVPHMQSAPIVEADSLFKVESTVAATGDWLFRG